MKKINQSVFLLFFFVFPLFAQQMFINGTVTDERGEPFIGASVLIQDTNNGTITDWNGNYMLEVNEGDILIFRFIGTKEHREIINKENKVYNVVLQEDDFIDETVLVAITAYKSDHPFIVEKNGKYGLTDNDGRTLLAVKYDDIDYEHVGEETFLVLEKKDKIGIATFRGHIVVPVVYDEVTIIVNKDEFHEKEIFFLVEKKDKEGLLDKNGKVVIPVKCDYIDNEFINGFLEVCIKDRIYYYDRKGTLRK